MAIKHYFAGPALVQVALRNESDTLGSYSDIGWNREQIPMVIQPKFLDVPSDDWAGADGAPADAQFMGAVAMLQLSLTKVERAIVDRLINGVTYGDTTDLPLGVMPQFGSFIRQGGLMFAMKLNSQQSGRTGERLVTLPYCFARGGGAVGQGTRYSSFDMQIEAWLDASTTRRLYTMTHTGE